MNNFKNRILCDCKNDIAHVKVAASQSGGELIIEVHDTGELVRRVWDKDDCEYSYRFTKIKTADLLNAMDGQLLNLTKLHVHICTQ